MKTVNYKISDTMTKRKNEFFIEKRPEGNYAIERPDAKRASDILPTQGEAIQKAKRMDPNAEIHVERVRDTKAGGRDKWRKL